MSRFRYLWIFAQFFLIGNVLHFPLLWNGPIWRKYGLLSARVRVGRSVPWFFQNGPKIMQLLSPSLGYGTIFFFFFFFFLEWQKEGAILIAQKVCWQFVRPIIVNSINKVKNPKKWKVKIAYNSLRSCYFVQILPDQKGVI